jgi:ribosomal protein L34E
LVSLDKKYLTSTCLNQAGSMEKHLHSKQNCPKCNGELTRIKRSDTERLLNKLTFNKFYNRKYLCYSCLNVFSHVKISNTANNEEIVFIKSDTKTLQAALPAVVLLIIVVVAMVVLSESFNPDTLSANFSFFKK